MIRISTNGLNGPTIDAIGRSAIGARNLSAFTTATKSNWIVYWVRRIRTVPTDQENPTVAQGPNKKPVSMMKIFLNKKGWIDHHPSGLAWQSWLPSHFTCPCFKLFHAVHQLFQSIFFSSFELDWKLSLPFNDNWYAFDMICKPFSFAMRDLFCDCHLITKKCHFVNWICWSLICFLKECCSLFHQSFLLGSFYMAKTILSYS